jgi:hypothetical protein
MKIELAKARRRLCRVWFIMSGVIFFIFFYQTLEHRFKNVLDEAWTWLLPHLLPTLTMILAVFLYQANQSRRAAGAEIDKQIDPFLPNLAAVTSVIYLLSLMVIILSYEESTEQPITEYYHTFDIFLTPFQSLITAAIGLVFYTSDRENAQVPDSTSNRGGRRQNTQ